MSQQTEAQKLADELAVFATWRDDFTGTLARSEAELRRLDAENAQLREQNTALDATCAKLEAAEAAQVNSTTSMSLTSAAQPAPVQEPKDIAALVEGMEVSIDVSTGDHDSGNRLFGTVTLVQENEKSKHGLILLVQDPEANFKTATPAAQREPLTPAQKIALAGDWFDENWAITKAVGMLVEYETRLAHGITKVSAS